MGISNELGKESKMCSISYPLVSIGVPIYNEEKFIKNTLQSLIDQDYPNLEIIISDNASTDDTLDICKQIIGEKSNIAIHSCKVNLGAAANFRYVLEKSKGKYFMWASGHDLWAPHYVSDNVTLLELTPSAVISFGASIWIDENNKELDKLYGYTDTRGMRPVSRFFTIFWGNMNPILGLIRRSSLEKAKPIQSLVGADLILLTALVLQGDFVHASTAYWQRRDFRHETNHNEKLKRYRSADYGLTKSILDKCFPLLRLSCELLKNIISSELSKTEKITALIALLACLPARYITGKK